MVWEVFNTGGANFWVVNLGVDSSNAAKTRGGTRGFPWAGDGDDGSKARGEKTGERMGRIGCSRRQGKNLFGNTSTGGRRQ